MSVLEWIAAAQSEIAELRKRNAEIEAENERRKGHHFHLKIAELHAENGNLKQRNAELAAVLQHSRKQLYVIADPHDLNFSDEHKRKAVDDLLSETANPPAILASHDAEVRCKAFEECVAILRNLAAKNGDGAYDSAADAIRREWEQQ